MATTAILLQDKSHETVTGLLALGALAVLQGLTASPLQPKLALLVPGLLTTAGILIIAGLLEWRRQQPLLAIVFTAFGLFACSQLPQLLHPPAGVPATLTGAGFLALWGIFALLLANAAGAAGRPAQIVIGTVGASLLCKVAALTTGVVSLTLFALLAGVVAGGMALLTAAQAFSTAQRR